MKNFLQTRNIFSYDEVSVLSLILLELIKN